MDYGDPENRSQNERKKKKEGEVTIKIKFRSQNNRKIQIFITSILYASSKQEQTKKTTYNKLPLILIPA